MVFQFEARVFHGKTELANEIDAFLKKHETPVHDTAKDLREGLRIMRARLGNPNFNQQSLRDDIAANEAALEKENRTAVKGSMNKTQRRKEQLAEHYLKCEALAKRFGAKRTDGKKVSNALRALENIAHSGATAYCNGEPYTLASGRTFNFRTDGSEAWEPFGEHIEKHVADILGAVPPGFFVNGDARGYALKIDNDNPEGKALIDALRLHTDWGGYGILSPEIDGD